MSEQIGEGCITASWDHTPKLNIVEAIESLNRRILDRIGYPIQEVQYVTPEEYQRRMNEEQS